MIRDSEWLTLPAAAARVFRAQTTLRSAIRLGRLAATKSGRDWFIREAELERWLREMSPRGRPPKDHRARTAFARVNWSVAPGGYP